MPSTFAAYIRALLTKPPLQILLVILSGGLAYSNTFHVPFVLDDFPAIVDNIKLESLLTFLTSNPFKDARWFASATFAFNRSLGGINVTGFHVINLIIHILTGFTMYALFTSTLRSFGVNTVQRYALAPVVASLAFVLHPLHTESVTYVVQRMTSLATLLYLMAILLYAQGCSRSVSADGMISAYRKPVLYLLAVISCMLAMSTKEISFTLPVVLAVYDICFLKGTTRERILRLVPFFFCMLVLFYYLVGVERGMNVLSHGGGEDSSYPLPRVTYLITQLSVLCTYLRLLVLPYGQNLDYDYPVFYSLFQPQVTAAFLLILSLLCGGAFLLKRSFNESCKFPAWQRISGFAVAWFFMTVSVESGIVPLIDKIFEHRVYLPSVWLFMAFGMLLIRE